MGFQLQSLGFDDLSYALLALSIRAFMIFLDLKILQNFLELFYLPT